MNVAFSNSHKSLSEAKVYVSNMVSTPHTENLWIGRVMSSQTQNPSRDNTQHPIFPFYLLQMALKLGAEFGSFILGNKLPRKKELEDEEGIRD